MLVIEWWTAENAPSIVEFDLVWKTGTNMITIGQNTMKNKIV